MSRKKREAKWLRSLRQGDFEVFEHVFKDYHRRIFSFLYRLTWNAEFAETLMHETFAQLWKGAMVCNDQSRCNVVLYRIAKRVYVECLDADGQPSLPAKGGKRGKATASIGGMALGLLSGLTSKLRSPKKSDKVDKSSGKVIAGGGEKPDEALGLKKSIDERVKDSLMGLPPYERIAFVLLTYQGLAINDICEVIEFPEEKVIQLLCQSEESLRTELVGSEA